MNKEKIAVLVDTCCDVPQTFVEQYHMYVIPLKVVYKDAEYLDGCLLYTSRLSHAAACYRCIVLRLFTASQPG